MSKDALNRRQILTAGALLGSAAAVDALPAAAGTVQGDMPIDPGSPAAPKAVSGGGYVFFTPDEAAFVEAITARLIPTDELGPGAREAGVATFIDRQLAGPFGQAQGWYMQGPWAGGTASQGYQSRLTPSQLYRVSIRNIDAHCRKNLGNKSFVELSADDQDKVVTSLEKGEIKFEGADDATFWDMLYLNTLEGFWSDPLYGGNRNMVGWKLIGFPGARYDYRPWVAKHGERFPLPPVSIYGRPGWSATKS